MSRAFTHSFVASAKHTDSRQELPDPGYHGLYLVIQPKPSTVKSYAVRYRFAGKAVKLTLGPTALPLAEARQRAAAIMADVARGIDPALAKKAAARAAQQQRDVERNTFRAVAEMHLKLEGVKQKRSAEKESTLKRLVYPSLGDMPIEQIKRSDVVRLLDRITAGEFARDGSPSPIMSNRARAAIGAVFNWFANRDDNFRSPIAGMKRLNEEAPRERVLEDDEIRKVWLACEANPTSFNRLCQFLLVTGARRTEGSALTWNEINNGAWTLPPARNKANFELVRPLNKYAKRILGAMSRIDDCPYVFPTVTGTAIVSYNYHKKALDEACKVQNWTLHDLRRSSRTLMSRAGINVDVAERMLGHKIAGVRRVYDHHDFQREMTEGFDALANLLDLILKPPPANVVTFKATS
jgi:integrase